MNWPPLHHCLIWFIRDTYPFFPADVLTCDSSKHTGVVNNIPAPACSPRVVTPDTTRRGSERCAPPLHLCFSCSDKSKCRLLKRCPCVRSSGALFTRQFMTCCVEFQEQIIKSNWWLWMGARFSSRPCEGSMLKAICLFRFRTFATNSHLQP